MSKARTEQASGSISAASAVLIPSGSATQLATGAAAKSAAPPGTLIPIPPQRSQRLVRPSRQ